MDSKNESPTQTINTQNSGPELLAQKMREMVQIGNMVVSIEIHEKVAELIQQSNELIENDNPANALLLLEEAQEMCEYALPDNHPTTQVVVRLRARVLILQERYAHAEMLLRSHMATLRKDQETNPADLAESLRLLAEIKKCTGKHQEAETCLQECIRLVEKGHATEYDTIISFLVSLFSTQLDCEHYNDANNTLQKALKISEQQDAGHPDIEKIRTLIEDLQDLL